MSGKHLANRGNWQLGARVTGDSGENDFVKYLAACLPDYYEVILKPPKIPIYSGGRGIVLDVAIVNTKTGETLFIEVKTGKQGGNATEERAGKFLSDGIKRRIKQYHTTPAEPVFCVFAGKIFNGESGTLNKYIIERVNKRGKITRSTVDPRFYREKVEVQMEGKPYAIMDHNYANITEVAKQIMKIV